MVKYNAASFGEMEMEKLKQGTAKGNKVTIGDMNRPGKRICPR